MRNRPLVRATSSIVGKGVCRIDLTVAEPDSHVLIFGNWKRRNSLERLPALDSSPRSGETTIRSTVRGTSRIDRLFEHALDERTEPGPFTSGATTKPCHVSPDTTCAVSSVPADPLPSNRTVTWLFSARFTQDGLFMGPFNDVTLPVI